jgi:DNA-binding NtrC family response regulator
VDRAFVPVSGGTTTTSVVEQALFGCVDAAPSRASRRNVEPLESAAGGTLFLDDIADMPLATQARLLGFLTERERTPPDDGAPRALDVRIIAATTSDLDEQVKTGRMLSDLFRRLAVIVVRTPPLRERSDDLEMLVHHFVMAAPKRTQSKTIGVSRAALTAIKQYAWPGNLLELENRIFRAVLVSQSPRLSVRDLDLPEYASEPEPVSLEQSRDRTEKETLRYALAHNRHNVTRAAKELRISRMTLYRLLEKHGMDRRN